MKKISARQLARAAGVSQATVSRVANESPLVHPETRRKVIEWARKLNYDLSGRSAGKGVCILLHHRKNPLRGYPAESLMALGTELPRRGYQMKIVWDESLPLLGDTLLCGGIDLTGDTENVRFWESNFTLPLIRVNAPSNRLNGVGAVILDGYSACLEAVRHLRKLGHSRIGFVSLEGRRNELAKLSRRWEGFAAGLRESGVEHPEEYGIFPDFRATEEEISRKVCGAIRSGYTALISPGDIFGLRIASALQKSGFRIPLDVSLIEGEWPGVSEFMNPPRTTVGIDYPALAVNLLEMLEH